MRVLEGHVTEGPKVSNFRQSGFRPWLSAKLTNLDRVRVTGLVLFHRSAFPCSASHALITCGLNRKSFSSCNLGLGCF
jgi:hypothetical protein